MGKNEIEQEFREKKRGENIKTMTWSGYNEVNVVRWCKEYVNVFITHKIPKRRHPHTRDPYPGYAKVSKDIRER